MRRCEMKENEKSPQQNRQLDASESAVPQDQLSPIWQELLGSRPSIPSKEQQVDDLAQDSPENGIPTLESDPWSTLIQAKGVEVVDLHKARLKISAQEVEQMLQIMQEQSTQQDDEGSSSKH